jgi:hypothetical protein
MNSSINVAPGIMSASNQKSVRKQHLQEDIDMQSIRVLAQLSGMDEISISKISVKERIMRIRKLAKPPSNLHDSADSDEHDPINVFNDTVFNRSEVKVDGRQYERAAVEIFRLGMCFWCAYHAKSSSGCLQFTQWTIAALFGAARQLVVNEGDRPHGNKDSAVLIDHFHWYFTMMTAHFGPAVLIPSMAPEFELEIIMFLAACHGSALVLRKAGVWCAVTMWTTIAMVGVLGVKSGDNMLIFFSILALFCNFMWFMCFAYSEFVLLFVIMGKNRNVLLNTFYICTTLGFPALIYSQTLTV